MGLCRPRPRLGLLGRTWSRLKGLFATVPAGTGHERRGRFAFITELEKRHLLSVTFNGPEFRVNTYTQGPQQTFFQTPEAVAMNPATGDYVAVWSSQGESNGKWNVYAQLYNAAGVAQGGEILVDTAANSNDQRYAGVAMNQQGSFVVAWSGNQNGNNIYARQFSSAGVAQGPALQVTSDNHSQFSTVGMDANGNFVVTWNSNAAGHWAIYAQAYSSAGTTVGAPLTVSNAPTQDQVDPFIAMNGAGNFVITWAGHQSGNWDVYAQHYGPGAVSGGGVFEVNTTTTNDQEFPSAAIDSTGNFVITWSGHQSNPWNVYAQQYNSAGGTVGSEFQVNTSTQDDRQYSTVAFGANDTLLFTWSSHNQDGSGWGIFGQAYTYGTGPLGSEFQINTFTNGDQEWSSVAADGTGHFVAVWSSNNEDGNAWGVYGRQFLGSDILVTPTTGLETTRAGGTATFQVVLAQPVPEITLLGLIGLFPGTVTIPLSSSNTGQGTVSPGSLTFTSNNWKVPQTVTVTGVNNGASGNVNYLILGGQVTSTDSAYQGAVMPTVYVTNTGATPTPGITVTPAVSDSVFLASVNNAVDLISSATGAVINSFPTGVAGDSVVCGPDGSIYVGDYYHNQVLHFSAGGQLLSSFGAAQLISPQGLTFGPNGNLFVTCTDGLNAGFVDEFSPSGTFLGTFIAPGSGGLLNAKSVVWGPDGNAYVSDWYNSEVLRYNGTTGAFMNVFAAANPNTDNFEEITFGPDGDLYVADYYSVYRYNGTTGAFLGTFVSGLTAAYGVRFDPAGNLEVADSGTGQIKTYSPTGAVLGNLDTGLNRPCYLSEPTSLVTSETGTTASFTVVLSSQPAANVTIGLSNANPAQGSLSQSSLTFTPGNWNVAQTVTVTGLDDHLLNGDQAYQITGSASSSDSGYNGLSMTPLIVTNTEADVAGINVSPGSLTTSESGTSAGFSVALNSEPAAPVTITLTNGNPGQGSLSQSSLTFTASNWNVTQAVTVTGLDDHIVNGDQTYQITGTASSSDSNYNGMTMTSVTVTNTEADVAGIYVTPTSLTTSESGTSASFTVSLTSRPTAPVRITFSNGNPAQGSLSQTSVNFGIGSWTSPQTVTVTGLDDHIVNGDQTYQITGTASSNDANYNGVSMTPVTVTNTEVDVASTTTIVSSRNPSVYGQGVTFTATVSAPSGTPTGTVTFLDGSTDLATLTLNGGTAVYATSMLSAGNHAITADYSGANLIAASTSAPLSQTVNAATLTVAADNAGKVFGQANPAFTDTITGFVNGDSPSVVSGAAALSTTATAGSGVGGYAITAAQGTLSAANYSFAFVNGTLNVTPATLTVTASNASKVYGQSNPAFTDAITGFVNGDNSSVVSGAVSLSTTATAGSAVGYYTIAAAQGTLSAANYSFAFVNGTLAVTPAPLTVAAINTSKVEGQPNPAFTASYSGFVNGDTPAALSGTLIFSTTATTSSPVGNYPVAPGGLSSMNYSITFVSGTLTVTSSSAGASSTSVVSSNDPSVYGQDVTFTATVSATGSATGTPTGTVSFLDGSTLLGNVTLNGGSAALTTPALAAGAHGIIVIYSGDSSFDASTSSALSQTVTPAPLTVTANDASKIYGQANPPFSAFYSGFVNGNSAGSLNGTLGFSTPVTPASPVGNYAITPGGLTSSNYTITFANGTLTVTPAALTVTANNKSMTYGGSVPTFDATYTGLVNGDTSAVVSGLSLSTPATSSSNVGTYTITASGSTAANYTITDINGMLTVNPAALTITANISMTYGGNVPTLNATYLGLVNGDTSAVVSGLGLSTTATSSSNVSTYTITASGGTAANYSITDVNGTLTVNPAALTITANDKSMTYGGSVPTFDATYTGLVNGDTGAVVSGLNLSTPATSSSNVGTYTITASGGAAANYAVTDVNGSLTITPAAVPPAPPPVTSPPPVATAPPPVVVLPPPTLASVYYAVKPSASQSIGTINSAVLSSTPPNAVSVTSTGSLLSSDIQLLSVLQGKLSSGLRYAVQVSAAFASPQGETFIDMQPLQKPALKGVASVQAQPVTAYLPTPHRSEATQRTDTERLDVVPASGPQTTAALTVLFSDARDQGFGTAETFEADEETRPDTLMATGMAAAAGYVLFNTRAGLWLLSALAARPMWKQFDPLEVLYAWERKPGNGPVQDADEKESLLSLVE